METNEMTTKEKKQATWAKKRADKLVRQRHATQASKAAGEQRRKATLARTQQQAPEVEDQQPTASAEAHQPTASEEAHRPGPSAETRQASKRTRKPITKFNAQPEKKRRRAADYIFQSYQEWSSKVAASGAWPKIACFSQVEQKRDWMATSTTKCLSTDYQAHTTTLHAAWMHAGQTPIVVEMQCNPDNAPDNAGVFCTTAHCMVLVRDKNRTVLFEPTRVNWDSRYDIRPNGIRKWCLKVQVGTLYLVQGTSTYAMNDCRKRCLAFIDALQLNRETTLQTAVLLERAREKES